MAKKTKRSCTTGPYVHRTTEHGTSIEGPNGEPIGWCGDNFSSRTGAVPHRENGALFAASYELYLLLAEAKASKAIKDDEWEAKVTEVLGRVEIS